MSWEEATHIWADQNGPDDGFYVQVRIRMFTHSIRSVFSSYLAGQEQTQLKIHFLAELEILKGHVVFFFFFFFFFF